MCWLTIYLVIKIIPTSTKTIFTVYRQTFHLELFLKLKMPIWSSFPLAGCFHMWITFLLKIDLPSENVSLLTLKVLNFWKFTSYCNFKTLMVGHGGSSAGSYLADPTSPIPSHCASILTTSTLRVNQVSYPWLICLSYVCHCPISCLWWTWLRSMCRIIIIVTWRRDG